MLGKIELFASVIAVSASCHFVYEIVNLLLFQPGTGDVFEITERSELCRVVTSEAAP